QATAHALLRHNMHADGAHFQSRVKDGLHPAYIGFNPSMTDNKVRTLSNEELVGAALEDVFNAVTMQDHLDGGITVMLHCARVKSTSMQMADEVTVDLYVTPRELHKSPEHIGSDIMVLVQAFCQEFALPHFQCFNKHCNLEIITPPTNTCKIFIYHYSQLFARQLDQCRWATISAIPHIPHQQPHSVHPPLRVTEQTLSTTELPAHSTPIFSTNPTIFGLMLISIRPNTDAVLDCFKISDRVLLQLQKLISTARSSRWEAVLRSPQWNLTYEQAVNIS
ncbi:hypothetical protein PISMIDRAFT_118584, partial [Pisolithus microcarpus 441]